MSKMTLLLYKLKIRANKRCRYCFCSVTLFLKYFFKVIVKNSEHYKQQILHYITVKSAKRFLKNVWLECYLAKKAILH